MSERRRPKRKAVDAALDAILRVKEEEAALEVEEEASNDTQADVEEVELSTHDGAVTLSQDLFLYILDFLPKPDLVHKASLVSSDWLQTTRNPLLWPALESNMWSYRQVSNGSGQGFLQSKMITSMACFLKFLHRPQFAMLRKLVPVEVYRTLRHGVFVKIADACPLLEEMDLTGSNLVHSVVPYDDELSRFPTLFPKLQKLSLCMRWLTNDSVVVFAESMGERLVQLHLVVGRSEYGRQGVCDDSALEAISRYCPNLESFKYGFCPGFYADEEDLITDKGIISLVQNCPKLTNLELEGTRKVTKKAFDYIYNHENVITRLCLVDVRLSWKTWERLYGKLNTFRYVRHDYCDDLDDESDY